MACLFPGAPDVDAYWSNITGKVDAITEPPAEAWDTDIYWDPEFADDDKTYVRRGGYLGGLATFEPLNYGIPPVAVGGEPDQWLSLKVAAAALADAGASELPAEIRQRTAIILGKGTYLNGGNAIAVQRGLVVGQTIDLIRRLHPEHSEEYLAELRQALKAQLPALGPETVPGLIPNIIVGRIANRLDLMGPAYTVDAACASSLVAIEHACSDLAAGDCDLALAGGSQVWMPVATMNLFCRLGALSRKERLAAFDAGADGTLLGEGIGMVVLKRLEDAISDGDRVYAVVRGVGISSDGRGMGVMAPRIEGEELALRRAYERAGVEPEHGWTARGARDRHPGRRRHRGPGADACVRRAGRPADAADGARDGQVDDQPHDPGRRRRGRDQDRARAPPPGAAADAERRAAEPEARAREDAVLPEHRDAPVDPRRRRAAPRRRQRVRVRRDQRACGARGVRRG